MKSGGGFHCGYVALLGRPNVGKSSLLNAMLRTHLSIVSPKPQTTRHQILGILDQPAAQILFVDTPGLHRGARKALNRALNRCVHAALTGVDVAIQVVEAGKWTDEDSAVYAAMEAQGVTRLLAVNKIDCIRNKSALLPFLAETSKDRHYVSVLLVSARRRQGLEALQQAIIEHLPEREALYENDELTDRSERFLAAEMVREQLMLHLEEELPFATTVEIEAFTERADGRAEIHAVIWVEREGQKAIVIGAGGAMLKIVGSSARQAMQRLFNRGVHLQLWVKVRAGWSDNENDLRRLGYSD